MGARGRQPQPSSGQSLLPLKHTQLTVLVPSQVCGLPAAAPRLAPQNSLSQRSLHAPSASFRPPSRLERKQSMDRGGPERRLHV